MAKIVGVISIYGVIVYFKTDPFIMLLPTLGGESCFAMMIKFGGEDFVLNKYYMTAHEFVYTIIVWVELAYLYT